MAKLLDEQWTNTNKDNKVLSLENPEAKLINWIEEWSSENTYRYIWWTGKQGEDVLKMVFQAPDTLHIGSLYPSNLDADLLANNLIIWALTKLNGDPEAIKHVAYYCVTDGNLSAVQKSLIEATERTDQTARLPDLTEKGIIAAAARAFGNPSQLYLGGSNGAADIIINFQRPAMRRFAAVKQCRT